MAATRILPLTLDGVCYEAGGARRLDGVSLRLEAGPKTLILGPNGSGKSLLLRLCHGLIGPSDGAVRWSGHSGAHRGRQAMVFQKPVMLRRSVRANVAYGLRLHRLPRTEREARIDHVLQRTGLAGVADRQARRLSGGEQQRLALARAWALRPEIIFLDEPTASLDPGATAAVETVIGELHAAGTKIVMTTHDLGQARRLADEIVFLHKGRISEHTAAASFFASPQSPEAIAFLEGRLLW